MRASARDTSACREIQALIRFTISIARRSSVSEASGVRNAACADSVTFSSFASRMICRERLVVKHIKPCVTYVAAFQRGNQCGLVRQGAARSIDIDDSLLHPGDPVGGKEAARLVAESQIHRYDVGAREQRVDVDQRHVNLGLLGAIPADNVHSHAFADARDFAADTAEPDHPQRLAKKLHSFMRCPDSATHLSIHACEIAGTGPQQRNRMLGNRGVSVTLNDVNL